MCVSWIIVSTFTSSLILLLLIPRPWYSVTSLVRAHLFLFICSLNALLFSFLLSSSVQCEVISNSFPIFMVNFSQVLERPPYPAFFNNPNVPKATRLYELKLQLVPMRKIPYRYVFMHPHPLPELPNSKSIFYWDLQRNSTWCRYKWKCKHGDDGVVRWRFVSWFPFFNQLVCNL